ncbi:uncharacterized protein LOC134238106 [Saccostrea cucullata]|uniref:uncharacterized protein LOC134238106 n=1 Tax=Saccostrea cuccullata TaxID=36930 RepID=UPI002ED38111
MFTLMEFIVVTCICLITTSGQDGRCDGLLMCCRGFEYIKEENICLPCRYPTFGLGCREYCTCSKENCNRFKGCYKSATEKNIKASTAVKIAEVISGIINNPSSTTYLVDITKYATRKIIGMDCLKR